MGSGMDLGCPITGSLPFLSCRASGWVLAPRRLQSEEQWKGKLRHGAGQGLAQSTGAPASPSPARMLHGEVFHWAKLPHPRGNRAEPRSCRAPPALLAPSPGTARVPVHGEHRIMWDFHGVSPLSSPGVTPPRPRWGAPGRGVLLQSLFLPAYPVLSPG